MHMTTDEIVRSYREAKAPSKQITILAQLNCCSTDEIRNLLKDAGALKYQRHKTKKAEKKEDDDKGDPGDTVPAAVPAEAEPAAGADIDPAIPEEVKRLIDNRLKEINVGIKQYEHEIRLLTEEKDILVKYCAPAQTENQEQFIGDYQGIPDQFDNMTGSMNLS